MQTVDLKGKTAVVTGAGGVLCGAMARKLAQCGAKVALIGRRREKLEAVRAAIEKAGGTALAVPADVLSPEELRRAEEEVASRLGPCDILVNGAGGNHPMGTTTGEFLTPEDLDSARESAVTFFDLTTEGIGFVFNVNFLGTLLAVQHFAKGMVRRGEGSIVNISSMASYRPLTKTPAYCAAKGAISNFTRYLAVYFSRTGVRVNAIAPGFFLTEQNRSLLWREDGTPTPRGERVLAHTPMGRFGQPEDLAGALLFLVDGRASAFVNGIVLPVDGAFSAFSGV